MAKKKKSKNFKSLSDLGGMVYSTNQDYDWGTDENNTESLSPNEQLLYVSRDKKQRGGKMVTLVEGFEGSDDELNDLGKFLKQKCGVGGTVKDGEIIVQGDHKDKVRQLLTDKGFKVKLKGG